MATVLPKTATGTTDWGSAIFGWSELGMDWFSLITGKERPSVPATVIAQDTVQRINPTVVLVLVAAVAIVWVSAKK